MYKFTLKEYKTKLCTHNNGANENITKGRKIQ